MKKILLGILIGLGLTAGVAYAATTINSSQVGSSPSAGKVLQTNGTISTWVATSTLGITGGTGLSSLNGLTNSTQTFATGSDANILFNAVSSGSIHTFTPVFTGQLSVARGGTGTSTLGAAGSLLVTSANANLASVDQPDTYGDQFIKDFQARIGTLGYAPTLTTANVAVIGDSWTASDYITGTIRNALQARYGNAGIGYVSFGQNSFPTQLPQNVVLTTAGTWTYNNGVATSTGVDAQDANSTDTATPASQTLSVVANTLTIHYIKKPSGGSFRYQVDGGAFTTVSTSNATTAFATTTINGLSTANHTLVVQILTAGSGVRLLGVDATLNTIGLKVNRLGMSGALASNFTQIDSAIWASELQTIAPNVVVVMLGTNESTASVSTTTYATNITTLVTRIRAALPLADVVLAIPSDNSGGGISMSQYRDQLRAIAWSNNTGFIDDYKYLGTWADANSRGLYSNTTHLSPYGGATVANLWLRFLTGTGLQNSYGNGYNTFNFTSGYNQGTQQIVNVTNQAATTSYFTVNTNGVGILNSAPAYALDLGTDAGVNTSINMRSGTTGSYLNFLAHGNYNLIQSTSGSAPLLFNSANLQFQANGTTVESIDGSTGNIAFGTAGNTVILANGNMGIGTNNPGAPFEVKGVSSAGSSQNIVLSSNNAGDAHDLRIDSNTGAIRIISSPNALTSSPDGSSFQLWGNGSGLPGQIYFDSGANDGAFINFRTAGSGGTITERMRIGADGNIKVATLTPSSLVMTDANKNVQSVVLGTNLSLSGNTLNATGGTGSGNSAWTIGNTLINNATSTDSVLVGTSTPLTAQLFVQTTGTKVPLIVASATGETLLTVLANGNVGIGTTTPVGALTVHQNASSTTNTARYTVGSASPVLQLGTIPLTSPSANGTFIAANPPTGFNGNFVNFQVNGSSVLTVSAAGSITTNASAGITAGSGGVTAGNGFFGTGTILFREGAAGAVAAYGTNMAANVAKSWTSGTGGGVQIGNSGAAFNGISYVPTSGTGTFNTLIVNPLINQTLTANGTTRGLLINPLLTSAFDYRNFETQSGQVATISTSSTLSFGYNVLLNPIRYTSASSSLYNLANASTLNIAGAPNGTSASTTIASSTGITIQSNVLNNVTNGYGLYVTSPTGAANNYAAAFTGGNVGIGTSAPATALSVSGSVSQTNAVNCSLSSDSTGQIICTSDERLKDIKGRFTGGLAVLDQINPIYFNFKGEKYTHAGFSAQNVNSVLPEATPKQGSGFLGLDINAVVAAVVNSVKELKQQVDYLFVRLDRTDTKVKDLQAQNEKLQHQLIYQQSEIDMLIKRK